MRTFWFELGEWEHSQSLGSRGRERQKLLGGRRILDTQTSALAFSPDGKRIVTGSPNGTIPIWEVATGKLILPPLKGHTAAVGAVTMNGDGTRIASAGHDDTVRVWDAATGQAGRTVFRSADRFDHCVIAAVDCKSAIPCSNPGGASSPPTDATRYPGSD